MSSLFESINQPNPKDLALSEALKILTDKFNEITEFNKHELKAISLLQTDEYLKELLDFYLPNKKHLKRKYAVEILKAFDMCSRERQLEKGFIDKIIHRNERY